MAFFTINGLEIDVDLESLDRSYVDVQNFDRTEGNTFEGVVYAQKRQWRAEIPWDTQEHRSIANRDWIKGRGHHFTFERLDGATTRFNKYSADGGPGFTATATSSATSKFGTWALSCASGQTTTVTTTFGSEGRYSMSVWKRDSGGTYILCTHTNDGGTARYYAGSSGTGLTTAFAWAALTASSGYFRVQLQGEDETGTAVAAALYDGLMVVPYALSTPQLAARKARTTAEPAFPYVELDGDAFEDLLPIMAKGFVDAEDMTQVQSGGVTNVRCLKLSFTER